MSAARTPLQRWRRLRFIPLAIAAAAFAAGTWTGLARLGLPMPGGLPVMADFHGALMIGGFLGTVISLERAVAIGRAWAYVAALASALGALLLFAGAPTPAAYALLLAGLALTGNSIFVSVRQPALFTGTLAVASACWAAGTGFWLMGRSAAEITAWWLAFLVLTVAAERLELSRLRAPPRISQVMFAIAASLIIVGAMRAEFAGGNAWLTGLGFFTATLWLLKHDVALRTVRQSGQTRFSAVCMLAAYLWLGIAGLLLLVASAGITAFSYDASIHAVTLGFILSMIFGHAPIILPAVTGLRITYSALLYGPLVLLHVSVALRVTADLFEWVELRIASGPLTVAALIGYVSIVLAVAQLGRAKSRPVILA